jgi:hypothetical protein
VDRLTTGRRHVRAGSVTVTELLSRQASPTHCTDSSKADTEIDAITDTIPVVVEEEEVEAAHRREPAKAAQLAKLASLGVAGVVLCGAVTISSMIAHQRREATSQAIRPSLQITGEQALLPDQLDETVPTPAPKTPLVADDEADDTAGDRPAPKNSTATPPAATPASDTGTSASGGAVTTPPVSDEALVREFYANLPDSPAAAFDLLSPEGFSTSLSEFLASWSKVTAIDTVDVVKRADGVLATVRMRLLGGGQLRIEQLLTVAESPRRIVGVQLLSAQRN